MAQSKILSHSRDEDEDEENVVSSGLSDIEQQNFYGCRVYSGRQNYSAT